MHAIVACITTGIQFRSGAAPARYCVIARFLKPLWANVYVLSILSLVYYTYNLYRWIIIETHAAVEMA